MKLLFYILLIYFFLFVSSQSSSNKTINGCGKVSYNQPKSLEDCRDDSEMCCFIRLKNGTENYKSFCFPAPEEIDKEDVADKIKEYTDYDIDVLACGCEQIKYLVYHLVLIFLIFI